MHKNLDNLVLFYFLIFQTVYSLGQSKKIKLADVAISYGHQKDIYNELTFNDYKSIAPNSEIFSNVNLNYYYHDQALNDSYFNSYFSSNFFLGNIGLSHEKYKNGLFRIGFQYFFKYDQFSTYAYQSNFIGNDTVFTNQGTPVYLDIYQRKKIISNSSSKKLLFDLSYIHKLPEEHQIVMYSGFGFLIGIGYQSILNISYDETIGTSVLDQFTGSTVAYKQEKIKTKPYMLSSLYVPIGLDIKLGKKNNFMNRIHIFLETRPAISLMKFSTAKSIILVSGNANLGLKVSL